MREELKQVIRDELVAFAWEDFGLDDAVTRTTDWAENLAELIAQQVSEKLQAAEQRGRDRAVHAIRQMPTDLGAEGWNHLAQRAAAADYDPRLVWRRKMRDDFTTATIEAAYHYGYRTASDVALKSGGAQ